MPYKVINDNYYYKIRCIQKKKTKSGYFFHATDDIPEVRKLVFEFINSIVEVGAQLNII